MSFEYLPAISGNPTNKHNAVFGIPEKYSIIHSGIDVNTTTYSPTGLIDKYDEYFYEYKLAIGSGYE